MRRSPLYIVALVVLVSSLLLAVTLEDRAPTLQHCEVTGTTSPDCIAVDHRTKERWLIVIVGGLAAGGLVWFGSRGRASGMSSAA